LKIALGSVQFGLSYGINNKAGIPSDEQVLNILQFAFNHGIDMIDTAAAYGNAEERLGKCNKNRFKFMSKFPTVNNLETLKSTFHQTLADLDVPKLYGYMAHQADVLIANPDYWKTLKSLKDEGKVEKIGYSLYHPEQLQKLETLDCIPDIVQLPYSLLDRKFESALSQLAEWNTEVHVRSVFLQGLYFMNPDHLPEKMQPLKPAIEAIGNICRKEEIDIPALALSFALHHPNIHKVVIGIDNVEQFEQNLASIISSERIDEIRPQIIDILVSQPELLIPVNW
jgi:aryl-alcohol dehydrogenase-like predicted oxidoreductase